MRSYLLSCVLIAITGCSSNSPTIVLPTTAFTDEQRIAIAQEDAEACNCGKDASLANASDLDN